MDAQSKFGTSPMVTRSVSEGLISGLWPDSSLTLRVTMGILALILPRMTPAAEFTAAPLRVPEGFVVELAAAPPLVAHPLMADFDEQGRLYVAANCGENLPRAELEKRLPNFVQRLEDTDGDGVFDRAMMFADKMTFPQGCLWLDGSLYVASSGAIWKLTDTDDDGVADVRVKLVGDFGYTGNAADVHGPFRGPDGRIYWCEGRHGHEIKDAEGKLISRGKAARIFSCRLDGSDVQTFCSGGMDNPVEIVFTPTGDMLGTVNLMYDKPRGDCLVHWQYGGVYPREDFAQSLGGEFVRTGDLLSEVHNFGHVAVSGLCRASGNQLGEGYDGSLFITQFNTNRIVRTVLEPAGSTFKVKSNEDFAVSTSTDFRPTDVLEDADGSLLVIDTGGWFRIGCPQSQIEKSHIHGAIYRIRRKDAAKVEDPRGRKLGWKKLSLHELLLRLDDARPAVRDRAVPALAERVHKEAPPPPGIVSGLMEYQLVSGLMPDFKPPVLQRWISDLAQRNTFNSLQQIQPFLAHEDPSVRHLAARALLYADRRSVVDDDVIFKGLTKMVREAPPSNAVATAALGRIYAKRADVAESLLEVTSPTLKDDRLLQHALTFALIESGDRKTLSQALLSPDEPTRNVAATALDALRRPALRAEDQKWIDIPAASVGKPLTDDERKQLLAIESSLPAGDAARGKALFASDRTACAKCHRIGKEGGQVGPDLSTIGRSRARRDLLEALLYPSASFARGFASYSVETKDGKVHSGIILGESSKELRLGIDAQNAATIAADNIEEIRAAELSIMPADVANRLEPQALADLIEYLKSLD